MIFSKRQALPTQRERVIPHKTLNLRARISYLSHACCVPRPSHPSLSATPVTHTWQPGAVLPLLCTCQNPPSLGPSRPACKSIHRATSPTHGTWVRASTGLLGQGYPRPTWLWDSAPSVLSTQLWDLRFGVWRPIMDAIGFSETSVDTRLHGVTSQTKISAWTFLLWPHQCHTHTSIVDPSVT
jgi:hypothetical protein